MAAFADIFSKLAEIDGSKESRTGKFVQGLLFSGGADEQEAIRLREEIPIEEIENAVREIYQTEKIGRHLAECLIVEIAKRVEEGAAGDLDPAILALVVSGMTRAREELATVFPGGMGVH
ncbi:MAG: hypothetical protein H0W63_04005 [Gemmatimonadaceae bacterium]|nr:hypothetical protein [Gemmatimonadaceae bacterium]